MWEMSARQWKEDVLEAASDKFELRLSEEMAAVRLEIARSHLSLLRWQFGFWLTQMLATIAMAMKISGR